MSTDPCCVESGSRMGARVLNVRGISVFAVFALVVVSSVPFDCGLEYVSS